MKTYTTEQLEKNYLAFLDALKKSFSGERLEKLEFMYSADELGFNLMMSPASGNKSYHNAYAGGYIDHVLNVARNSFKMMKLYQDNGGVIDFTQEELLFAAFHHDLGKLGVKGELQYVPNDSQWHIDKMGQIYKSNPNITYMSYTDRGIFLLNQYGIKFTEKEYFGMKLTDGMFDDDNHKYLKVFDNQKILRTNIGYILHWADHMSTCIERDSIILKK